MKWPLIVSSDEGQYFAALVYVRPGQEEKLPAFMAAIQVEHTGNPTAAWR